MLRLMISMCNIGSLLVNSDGAHRNFEALPVFTNPSYKSFNTYTVKTLKCITAGKIKLYNVAGCCTT